VYANEFWYWRVLWNTAKPITFSLRMNIVNVTFIWRLSRVSESECILILVLWFFCACSSCVTCWDQTYFGKMELDFALFEFIVPKMEIFCSRRFAFSLCAKNSVSIECNRKCTIIVAIFYSLCRVDRAIIITLCLHVLTCKWKSLQEFGVDPIPSLW